MMKQLALALMALGLVGCGEDAPPPKTIKDISEMIEKVEQDDDVLKIYLLASSALREKDHFQNASMTTYKISENLVKYFPDVKQPQLVYIIAVEMVDKFGNQSIEPALQLEYSIDDIKKINFDNLFHRDVLELAESIKYFNMAGMQVVVAWCKEEENRSVAQRFCAKNIY